MKGRADPMSLHLFYIVSSISHGLEGKQEFNFVAIISLSLTQSVYTLHSSQPASLFVCSSLVLMDTSARIPEGSAAQLCMRALNKARVGIPLYLLWWQLLLPSIPKTFTEQHDHIMSTVHLNPSVVILPEKITDVQ